MIEFEIKLLIIFFVIEFFLTIVSYKLLKNDWIFRNHGLFFRAEYSRNSTISYFKIKLLIFIYSNFILKMFLFEKLYFMISAIENFTNKIRNGRVVDNMFPDKIGYDL